MKKVLIKAIGAIHISHNLSLMQQQLWNLLLHHAYPELLERDEHRISIGELKKFIGTQNDPYMKQAILSLGIELPFNILNRDKNNEWGTFKLLDKIELSRGIITYSFDKRLRRLLYKPDTYSYVNLDIEKKFKSK